MTKFALKGLLARKLRTALTAIAIVLGVAMVSGTYVLTDSIDSAFDGIFTDVRGRARTSSSPASRRSTSPTAAASTAPTLDESLLGEVRGLPGVAQAEGGVDSDSTSLIGEDGKAIVVRRRAATSASAIADGDSPFNPLSSSRATGRRRRGRDRQVDGRTRRTSRSGTRSASRPRARSSGSASPASSSSARLSIGGATLAGFDLPTAQRLFDKDGQARPDRGRGEARRHRRSSSSTEIREILPPDTQVRTGAASGAEDASETNEFITFLQGFLLAFGGIALFVGAFVIANSLSITIAQRTREFATLRTLGASRRQVLGLDHHRGARRGRRSRRSSASSSASLLAQGPLQALRRGRLHAAEQRPRSSRRARSSSRCSSASSSRCSRACVRRCARRACRRSRRCARARRCREGRFARFRDGGGRCSRSLGFAALLYGALRQRARHDADPALDGARHAARSSSASRSSRRGSCGRSRAAARLARDEDRRRCRARSRATTRGATRSGPPRPLRR